MKISKALEGVEFISFEGVDVDFDWLNLCDRATKYKKVVTYVTSEKYREVIANNKSIFVLILSPDLKDNYYDLIIRRKGAVIFSKYPEVSFYHLHERLVKLGFYNNYEFDSLVGNNCCISKKAIIERGVVIGNNVVIGDNSIIKKGTTLGDNVEIGCNSIIGSEGFQLIKNPIDNSLIHSSHVGGVSIGHNVFIGDNTCVCKSLFDENTTISDGTKIDNLVHVGHNVFIGKNVVITAQCVLCGSCSIMDNSWIGPNSSILNRVIVGKNSLVGLGSVVTRDVLDGATVYGSPAKQH